MSSKITLLLILNLLLAGFYAKGQKTPPVNEPNYNLPKAFALLPDTIPVTINNLQYLLNKSAGDAVYLNTSKGLIIEGAVDMVSSKYNDAIKTAVIRFNKTANLIFTLTKSATSSGNSIYKGLITGRNTGDAYRLSYHNDQYYFLKEDINKLRAE